MIHMLNGQTPPPSDPNWWEVVVLFLKTIGRWLLSLFARLFKRKGGL